MAQPLPPAQRALQPEDPLKYPGPTVRLEFDETKRTTLIETYHLSLENPDPWHNPQFFTHRWLTPDHEFANSDQRGRLTVQRSRPAQKGQNGQVGPSFDALLIGAADHSICHDNRLGSRLGYEGQHFFRNTAIGGPYVALLLGNPAPKVGGLGVFAGLNTDREQVLPAYRLGHRARQLPGASLEVPSWPSCPISCMPARSRSPRSPLLVPIDIMVFD